MFISVTLYLSLVKLQFAKVKIRGLGQGPEASGVKPLSDSAAPQVLEGPSGCDDCLGFNFR